MEEHYWVCMVILSFLSPQLTGRWAEIVQDKHVFGPFIFHPFEFNFL